MDLQMRLTDLEGKIRIADERLNGLRNQLEQSAQERLLLMGAMLEVRRMLAPEPQSLEVTEDATKTASQWPFGWDRHAPPKKDNERVSPSGTD